MSSHPGGTECRTAGPPTWLLVLLTLGSWLLLLAVEVVVLPGARRAADEAGRAVGVAGNAAFAFSIWWADYWFVAALVAVPCLLAVAVWHAVLPASPRRRRVGWAWVAVLVAGPTVVALASLAAGYLA